MKDRVDVEITKPLFLCDVKIEYPANCATISANAKKKYKGEHLFIYRAFCKGLKPQEQPKDMEKSKKPITKSIAPEGSALKPWRGQFSMGFPDQIH